MSEIERQYYENEAFWSDLCGQPEDRERIEYMCSLVPEGIDSLLDAGCGNGLFLNTLAVARPDIKVLHGFDRSLTALKHVRFEKTQGSIDTLPFNDKQFDCVTSLEVIEHLPNHIYGRALSEIARVARKYIIIAVPYQQDLDLSMIVCSSCRTHFNPDYHLRSFGVHQMRSLFDQYGFQMKKSNTFGVSEEFAFQKVIKFFSGTTGNRFSMDIPCPVCGEILPGKPTPTVSSGELGGSRGFKAFVKSLWPRVRAHRWLTATYEKS